MNSQVPPYTGAFFEVPNGLMDVEGNDASRLPFDYLGPVRCQQVYDASQFSKVPIGGAFLCRIFLRADCANRRTWRATNVLVNLSITMKGPDKLSSSFAENIGLDELTVFGPATYDPPGTPGCPAPIVNGQEINLATPFFYDPSRGNLLLDLRSSGIDWTGGPLGESTLDAQNVLGDSISRVAAFSLSTNTAEVVDTVGLVTAFEFFLTPSIKVTQETNNVVLTWPASPYTFRLQWADAVGAAGTWADYPGTIGGGALSRRLSIPLASLPSRKFFRLFWNTPQPLPTPPTSPAVQVDAAIKP